MLQVCLLGEKGRALAEHVASLTGGKCLLLGSSELPVGMVSSQAVQQNVAGLPNFGVP